MSRGFKTLREIQAEQGWGDVAVGDTVTSRGKHGAGQPAITGEVKEIVGQRVYVLVRKPRAGNLGPGCSLITRTISNLRRVS